MRIRFGLLLAALLQFTGAAFADNPVASPTGTSIESGLTSYGHYVNRSAKAFTRQAKWFLVTSHREQAHSAETAHTASVVITVALVRITVE